MLWNRVEQREWAQRKNFVSECAKVKFSLSDCWFPQKTLQSASLSLQNLPSADKQKHASGVKDAECFIHKSNGLEWKPLDSTCSRWSRFSSWIWTRPLRKLLLLGISTFIGQTYSSLSSWRFLLKVPKPPNDRRLGWRRRMIKQRETAWPVSRCA